MAQSKHAALAAARLTESGLTAQDAKLLKLEVLPAAKIKKLNTEFHELPALKINYHDPRDLTKTLNAHPKWPAFYRIRYLDTPKGFAGMTEKPQRYAQPSRTGVCAYFPRNADWPKIIKNTKIPIFVTEGEIKAAKGCKEGFPTIGLGGVYSFKSKRLGTMFLDELKAVDWVQRVVYIVYDSDVRSNEQVCEAINALASELEQQGAIPMIVDLPDLYQDSKTGLDDFLTARSPGEFEVLVERAESLTMAQQLWKMNREIKYIYDPGLVLIMETDQKITPASLKEHVYSSDRCYENVVKKDGSLGQKQVSAGKAWLNWEQRGEAGRLTYEPGAEKILNGCSIRKSKYNTWPGWGCESKKGTVQPFLNLVDHIFTGASKEEREWFLRWCAYPIQNPGVKLFTAAVIHGTRHGTGKSLIGYTLGKIYGRNFTEISQADLHSSFNEWAEAKQFVLGDDVTGSNRRQDADMLKKLITQQELRVNMKFVPTYVVPDCINYLFTSNHPDAFFLEDDDRRYFIHETEVGPKDEKFYTDYAKWLNGDGPTALFHYLLNLKLGKFNPAAPAMKTAAKARMIADVKSDLGSWVARMLEDPDGVLVVGEANVESDLFTNRQLLALYDPMTKTKCTANGMGRELRKAGVLQALNGNPIQGPDGRDRYYIVRNPEKWVGASWNTVKDYLQEQIPKTRKAKFK